MSTISATSSVHQPQPPGKIPLEIDLSKQGGDTPIDAVVRAATGLMQILTPYTKEGVESLRILPDPYTIGSLSGQHFEI